MIDPAVERQYADSQELLGLWRTFHDFFVMGVHGDNITPEKEEQFLELKSRIAMLHDSFMEALSHDQNIGQEVLNIISRAITLKHLSKQNAADIKKMEIEWHESYLLLNETIGALEDKRSQLAQVNKAHYQTSKAVDLFHQKAARFLGSFYFKATVIVAAVLFGTVGVQMLGIYDYDELGKIPALQPPYRTFKNVIYRKLFNPDAGWITIDTMNRKPFASWPSGVKTPTDVVSDDKSVGAKIAPMIQPKLSTVREYRHEVTEKQFKGKVHIYTYLFPDTATAKAIEKEWSDYSQGRAGKALAERARLRRDNNVIVVLEADNRDMIDQVNSVFD